MIFIQLHLYTEIFYPALNKTLNALTFNWLSAYGSGGNKNVKLT